MVVRDFRDLIVWQRATELAREAYRVAAALPIEERFELASQIRRSATSIGANIVEGHARRHRGEFLQFLRVAYGSLKELDNHLLTAVAVGRVDHEQVATALSLSAEVSRMLAAMRHRLGEARYPESR